MISVLLSANSIGHRCSSSVVVETGSDGVESSTTLDVAPSDPSRFSLGKWNIPFLTLETPSMCKGHQERAEARQSTDNCSSGSRVRSRQQPHHPNGAHPEKDDAQAEPNLTYPSYLNPHTRGTSNRHRYLFSGHSHRCTLRPDANFVLPSPTFRDIRWGLYQAAIGLFFRAPLRWSQWSAWSTSAVDGLNSSRPVNSQPLS